MLLLAGLLILEALLGEDVGEGEPAVLQELVAEGLDLPPEAMVRGMSHRWGSEPVMGMPDPCIRAAATRSAYPAPRKRLPEI
jgi:hypothetical protein